MSRKLDINTNLQLHKGFCVGPLLRELKPEEESYNQHYTNKRHAMHAEAMTFHKGSLIIFRTFVKKLGYIKVTDTFCAE